MKLSWSNCPYCKKTLDFKVEGGSGWSESPIGVPSFRHCPHCGGKISDGKKEWCDLNVITKIVYLLRTVWTIFVIGVLGGALAAMVLRHFIFGYDSSIQYFLYAWAAWLIGCSILWGRDTWLDIKYSNERVKNLKSISKG